MKDVNFIESNDLFLFLDTDDRDQLIEQIKSDTEFLHSLNIMDYSLLLGVNDQKEIRLARSDSSVSWSNEN